MRLAQAGSRRATARPVLLESSVPECSRSRFFIVGDSLPNDSRVGVQERQSTSTERLGGDALMPTGDAAVDDRQQQSECRPSPICIRLTHECTGLLFGRLIPSLAFKAIRCQFAKPCVLPKSGDVAKRLDREARLHKSTEHHSTSARPRSEVPSLLARSRYRVGPIQSDSPRGPSCPSVERWLLPR